MSHASVSLASENYSGVHPVIMQAILDANQGHERSYGKDKYSSRAVDQFRKHFGKEVNVHFIYNGTGANILALSAMTRSFHAILCADIAHVYVHESTAVEALTGCRLIAIETVNGKISVESLRVKMEVAGDLHSPQPRVLSITQPTEYGTLYSSAELKELSAFARENNLLIHADGARFFNAAAATGQSLKSMGAGSGIDVLSLGGTKNGMMFGEALLFFNEELYANSGYLLKRSTQLASKMRFISCQFEAMLNDDLWLSIAGHSNKMARILERELRDIPGITITHTVETNAVFAVIPKNWNETLQEHFYFYVWRENINEVRLMCSFDTSLADIEKVVSVMKKMSGS